MRNEFHRRPRTAEELHDWVGVYLGVDAVCEPLMEGSCAPFDYLTHAYFERGDCVVWACRGGGKTFYAAVATALDLLFKPGIEVRVLGGSLEQSGRMHAHLRRLFERPFLRGAVEGRPTDRRIRLRNGSVVEAMAQSHTSVRGCHPQKLRCDEVELFDPDVWRAAQLVTKSRVCGGVRVRGCVEALSTMHRAHGLMASIAASCAESGAARTLFRWGVTDVLERCEESRACAPCPLLPECGGGAKRPRNCLQSSNNPLPRGAHGHVTIDDAIALKARSDRATWDAEMRCLRPRRDDLVLPEFSRGVHVFGAPGDARDASDPALGASRLGEGVWVVGMDFGFRAPAALLWATIDAEGVIRVVDERVERESTIDAHVAAMRASPWPLPAWMGVDPAGSQRSEQTGRSNIGALRRAGLRVRSRRVGLHEGLSAVRARLRPAHGAPTLFVHARCRVLIESLETYHYPSGRPDALVPAKDGADHAVDALRYLVVNADRGETAVVRSYL